MCIAICLFIILYSIVAAVVWFSCYIRFVLIVSLGLTVVIFCVGFWVCIIWFGWHLVSAYRLGIVGVGY